MNEELSVLAEISSKPLGELSKEEMARLVIPFLDMTRLKLKCTTHEPFSPLKLNNQYPTDVNTKLRRQPLSGEDYINMHAYTKNLENKLHRIMNNPPKEYYGMIPNASFGYVLFDNLDHDFFNESMPEETIDINANIMRIILEMCVCRYNIGSIPDFHYFLSKDSFYKIPVLTASMTNNPSEFIYFADLFKNGTDVVEKIKDINTRIDVKFEIDIETIIRKIANNSNMDALDIKLSYLVNQGSPVLVSKAGLRIRKQDRNVVEEVLSLSNSSILHRCFELVGTWQERKGNAPKQDIAINMNGFVLYEVSGGLVAVTKDGMFSIDKDKGASIKRFVNAVVTRALDISHSKEDMIRDLVDIDR